MERFMEQVIFKYLRAEPEDHYFLMVSGSPGGAPPCEFLTAGTLRSGRAPLGALHSCRSRSCGQVLLGQRAGGSAKMSHTGRGWCLGRPPRAFRAASRKLDRRPAPAWAPARRLALVPSGPGWPPGLCHLRVYLHSEGEARRFPETSPADSPAARA